MFSPYRDLKLHNLESILSKILFVLVFGLIQFSYSASAFSYSELPQYAKDKHLGVASCASSVCHGKGKPVDDNNVLLNEYRTWTTEDRHARAYQTLMSKDSKRIARNLGLENAHTAKICLDCHADNIAKSSRGPKFQINDGVGCEACHGGSEQWIESHTEEGVTHADNLSKGMYPTEEGVARARLCLSCHYGTKDKLANHKIMGAGHPRLTFELETFTANQPAHYVVDADYSKRKGGDFVGFTMWMVGQLESAKSSLSLMKDYLIDENQLVPELFFYDCHACHHPMSDIRWGPTAAKAGMPPGVIRLQDANFLMLLELTKVVLPEQNQPLQSALINLHQSSLKNKGDLKQAVNRLSQIVNQLDKSLTNQSYTESQTKAVRSRLLKQSAAGEYRDYAAAEQAFLAIESITIALKQDVTFQKQLDALYDTLSDENSFKPGKFKSLSKKLKGVFN